MRPYDVCRVVLQKEDRFLLVQETSADARGLWTFPGGYRESGENLEDAGVREAAEETGLEVEIIRRLIMEPQKGLILHFYQAKATGGELSPQPGEIKDSRWLTRDEIEAREGRLRDPQLIMDAIESVTLHENPIRR